MLTDYDPEGDRLEALENARFLRDTYTDYEPECTCIFTGDRADNSDCDLHGERPTIPEWYYTAVPMPPTRAATLLNEVDDLMLDEGVA